MMHKNVSTIGDYCSSCGACISVCPEKCIWFDKKSEKISVNNEKCIQCKLCLRSCTGLGFDFSKNKTHHNVIGKYNSLSIGRTNNQNILKSSTSGGLTASILLYCLKNKIIDSAVILTENTSKPLDAKCAIARTESDILKRTRSRYHIVPLVKALKNIKNEKKVAFVGLPCHIQAIRKLQELNNKNAKKIILLIGLYCGHNQHFASTKFMLKNLKVRPKDIESIDYRGPKWLGGFNIKANGKTFKLSKELSDFTNYMFIPKRCMVCYDYTNEFSDISLGDAWSKKPSEYGWNEIITRSAIGSKIINNMVKEEQIITEPLEPSVLLKSHPGSILFKKKGIFMRMKKMKLKPNYNIEQIPKLKTKEKIFQYMFFRFIQLMHSRPVKFTLTIIPLKITGSMFYIIKKITLLTFLRKKK